MSTVCLSCGMIHPGLPCLPTILQQDDQEPLGLGARLAGRYYIISLLHRGGTSAVYRAQDDLRDGAVVAIKELRPIAESSAQDRADAERWFAREAAISSVLAHPLIPVFFSSFEEGDHSYIVQELVEGENLQDLLGARGPLPERWVLSWGEALAGLLTYLHTQPDPIVYRDMKPDNVVLRGRGDSLEGRELVLVDFGIARQYRPGEVGTTIGTPGYAPPEQYQGFSSPQSDIYALGATLHRLLTGFSAEGSGAPFNFPDAHSLNPFVSRHTADVLKRCLYLNPVDRFETAADVKYALHEAHRAITTIATGVPLNMSVLAGDPQSVLTESLADDALQPSWEPLAGRRGGSSSLLTGNPTATLCSIGVVLLVLILLLAI